jgi:DegV family protein with EDD domain
MARITNLIVDSCCDLPMAQLQESGVRLLRISYTDTTDVGLTGTDDLFTSISAHDFYHKMRDGACPVTSQPSQGEMDRVFTEATADGTPAVYLAFSSGLSGCYEGALASRERLVAEGLDPALLTIVDTRLASTALALLVDEAIRLVNDGMGAAELAAWAKERRYLVQSIFMVDDLDALRRGGRIPRSVASVGTVLRVKPLLTFDPDGRLATMGASRGRNKAISRMCEFFEEHHDDTIGGPVVCIGNADADADAERLRQKISDTMATGEVRFIETDIGPTCGCHVGAGMLSCTFWGHGPRTADQAL